jgi:hypothetical protein
LTKFRKMVFCSRGDRDAIETFITHFLLENGLTRSKLLKNKEWTKLLVGQITKKSNLSLRKIATIIGINREAVRKLSEEPSPRQTHDDARPITGSGPAER